MMETVSVYETLVCLNLLTRVSVEEDFSVLMCYEKPGDLLPASATISRPRPLLCAIQELIAQASKYSDTCLRDQPHLLFTCSFVTVTTSEIISRCTKSEE